MTEHTLVHEAGRNHDVLVSTYITDASTPSQQTIVTMEYAKLLCSELRGTSFKLRDNRSAYIYREGDTYVMGWIGYGDYLTASTRKPPKFCVFSPFHENNKYRSDKVQHHMVMYDLRDKAIKRAAQMLRSYTVEEGARISNYKAATSICNVQGEAASDVRVSAKKLELQIDFRPKGHRLLGEFKHMISTGYQFSDQSIKEGVLDLLNKFDVMHKRNDKVIPVLYVEMRTNKYGDKMIGTAKVANGRDYHPFISDVSGHEVYLQEEVPDWIVNRVSTLQIMPNDSYVEGVGFKHCDTAYTIHVDEANPFLDA
jgi:hypothetical protein